MPQAYVEIAVKVDFSRTIPRQRKAFMQPFAAFSLAQLAIVPGGESIRSLGDGEYLK
jgi:hypothetical protein